MAQEMPTNFHRELMIILIEFEQPHMRELNARINTGMYMITYELIVGSLL